MSDDERRRFQRVTTKLKVQIHKGPDDETGETRDVSEGGAGIVTARQLTQGEELEVELLLQRAGEATPQPVKTMAKVMWSAETDSGAYTAGLQFAGPSKEAMERLKRFLESEGGDEEA